jgi:hypothetical protein
LEAEDDSQLRRWAASLKAQHNLPYANCFCRRGQFWAPARVEKFKGELHRVLAYLRWPARGQHRLRTTNLSVGRQTRLPTG